MYPVGLADAVRDGFVTQAEAESLYSLHRLIEHAQAAQA
jgi:hypothetical protein